MGEVPMEPSTRPAEIADDSSITAALRASRRARARSRSARSSRPASNWGFTSAIAARGPAKCQHVGGMGRSEMKLRSKADDQRRPLRIAGVNVRRSRPSRSPRGCPRSPACSCPRPTSTAYDPAAPRSSSTRVKPPVLLPASKQVRPVGSMPKRSSAAASLTPPRDTHGCGPCRPPPPRSPARSAPDGLRTARPSTRTSPAAIASCARARLSNRPVETSN